MKKSFRNRHAFKLFTKLHVVLRYLDSFDGLTSADESRPMSEADMTLTSGGEGGMTDASSWIAAGIVTLRRNAASRSARPLTRYLPVTGQENFDLRAHIESAGHQVGHPLSVGYTCCDNI
jgi:hypothetical protein